MEYVYEAELSGYVTCGKKAKPHRQATHWNHKSGSCHCIDPKPVSNKSS